jgi:phospholipase C
MNGFAEVYYTRLRYLLNDLADDVRSYTLQVQQKLADVHSTPSQYVRHVMSYFPYSAGARYTGSVLHQLALGYVVCDHWFSPLPGPTFPNRWFVHAGTSGGLHVSPHQSVLHNYLIGTGFQFRNGTIYRHIDEKTRNGARVTWRIYHGGDRNSKFIEELKVRAPDDVAHDHDHNVKDIDDLRTELHDGACETRLARYDMTYSFIEPRYGHWWGDDISSDPTAYFLSGESQHAPSSVSSGEVVIKKVYDWLRTSSIWPQSALVITYDEHGGFYDHVPPPEGDQYRTGDDTTYASIEGSAGFDFRRLGPRVPAVVVSPLIARGTIDATVYDHASIVKTVCTKFGITPFTDRVRNAHDLSALFTLDTPRTDAPEV